MSELTPIQGSEVDLQGCQDMGLSHPAERIDVTLLVRRNSTSPPLPSVEELCSQSPLTERNIGDAEFESTYGADTQDVAQVEQFAKANGLAVIDVNRMQRTVTLAGTAPQIGSAFGVELRHFEHPADGPFRGHSGPVLIPQDLAEIVKGVFGLDTRPVAKPHLRQGAAGPGTESASPIPGSYLPTQVAEAYQFPANTTGAGQIVGVIELGGGFQLQYLQQYFDSIGVPMPEIEWVSVAGGQNSPGQPSDGEVYLDLEIVGAVAPGAKQIVYFAPANGILQALQAAVHDTQNKVNVISLSWGLTESANSSLLNAVSEVIQEGAFKGRPVCVSSGDNGSSDTRGPGGTTTAAPDGLAHVDFPASSPYALACGGTKLTASGATIENEIVWNQLKENAGATGGGVSAFFPVPSYQQSAGLAPKSVNPGQASGRGVPDVAGHADPINGYWIKVGSRPPSTVGGTSAVAPLWAALIVRLNEALGSHVSFLNGFLYQHGQATGNFNDILQGNNDSSPQVGGYSAGAGWDPCTGWGSPHGQKLLENLRGLGAKQTA